MQEFDKIFQNKLAQVPTDSRLPVACSLFDVFHTQKSLLASAQTRRQSIELKNKKVAEQSLTYRAQLHQKLTLLQQKHDKNRKDALTKVVKSQQQRNNYRRDIFSRHKEGEKSTTREKLNLFRQHSKQMEQYWQGKKLKSQRSFRSQSAVRPLYWDSVQRKKGLQRQQGDQGMQTKSNFLSKHEGRDQKVHQLHERKKEEVHEVHKEKIEKVLQKNNQILDQRITSLINNIGNDFRKSGEVLQGKAKAHQKRMKDRKIDDQDHRLTVKSNLMDRMKQRSASLSQCNCRRINNIQERTITPTLKQETRHIHFGDTLRKLERQPSQIITKRSEFITRSHSFRSTVSYNKDLLSHRKHTNDTDRLRREKEVAEALALKKDMEVEGNCYVRKTAVK